MPRYPHWVYQRLVCPRIGGGSTEANAFGRSASLACGSFVSAELVVDDENIIQEARFSSNGCGYMVAAAAEILGQLNGNDITEGGSFDTEFYSRVEHIPAERGQCVEVVIEAVRAAFADRRSRLIDEFNGDDALICTCFGVEETSVRNAISRGALDTVDEVADATNAGSGCGSCRMLLQEILDSR